MPCAKCGLAVNRIKERISSCKFRTIIKRTVKTAVESNAMNRVHVSVIRDFILTVLLDEIVDSFLDCVIIVSTSEYVISVSKSRFNIWIQIIIVYTIFIFITFFIICFMIFFFVFIIFSMVI